MKYSCKITGWGDEALDFMTDPDMNFIILFNETAPAELADIAILHTEATLTEDPAVGDILTIGTKVFKVTAVGEEAKHTLRDLGHCTIDFKGGDTPERPGCIMVEGVENLVPADIQKDVVITLS